MHHLFFRVTHDGRDAGIYAAIDRSEALDDYARDRGFDGHADMLDRLRGLPPEVEDVTDELIDAGAMALRARRYAAGHLLAFADPTRAGAVAIATDVEVALLGQLMIEAGDRALPEWLAAVELRSVTAADVARNSIHDGAHTLEIYREAAERADDIETVVALDLLRADVEAERNAQQREVLS